MIARLPLFCVVFTLYFVSTSASPLAAMYERAMSKRDEILQMELNELISKSVPQGIEKGNPKIAEYETFKQSPEANFIHDGLGRLHFRQFRRINLNTAMNSKAGI